MPRTLSLTLLALATAMAEESPVIIVTAERGESELDRAPVSVEVVQAETISERGGAVNATDWLRELPGVGVFDTGGGVDGGLTSVRLRGLDGKYTLFLVDGIPVEDQSNINGSVRLPLFQTAGLRSIEVLKGSQSGLYGSGAVGGVIDLRTARPTAAHEVKVSATAGSFGSLGGDLVATGPIGGAGGYAVSLSGLASSGFSATTLDPDGDPDGHEDDSVQRWSARGRFELKAGDGLTLHLIGAQERNRQEYDGTGPDDGASENLYEQWQLAGGGTYDAGGAFTGSFDLSYKESGYTSQYSTLDPGTYDSTTVYASVRGRWLVAEHVDVGIGADGRRDTALTQYGPTLAPVFDTGVNQYGIYGTATWSDDRFEAGATGRVDRHQTFGSAPTGRLAAAWFAVPDEVKLRGALSSGFRAPTLYQLYNVEPFMSVGNPELDPERSLSGEVGLDWTPGDAVDLGVTVFRSEVEDLIVYVDPDGFGGVLGTYANDVGNSVSRGVEAGGSAEHAFSPQFSGRLAATYTYLDSEDAVGLEAPFAPEHSGSVRGTLTQTTGSRLAFRQTLGLRRSTSYFASPGEADRVDGATVADAAVGVSFDERWDLCLRVDNLFDERYVANSSFGTVYATPPRSYWLTLSGKF